MGTQGADDAGRELEPVWLGPKGMRWPFDWPVRRWIFFAVTTVLVGLLLAFAVPLALALGALIGWGGRSAGRLIDPARPRRWMWIVVIAALLLVLLVLPVRALALPLPLLLVPFAAVGAGLYATRLYGRLLDWNRPIGFYVRMPHLVAAGPRLRPEREVDPARLVLTAGPDADRRDYEPIRKIHKQFEGRETVTPQEFVGPAFDLSPHHWTGPGDEIEPGKLIRTHDRVPSKIVNVETTLAERDAAVETFVEELMTTGHIPADVPLMADPARPRKPRWIRTVPGGIQIGSTILDFTPRGPQ